MTDGHHKERSTDFVEALFNSKISPGITIKDAAAGLLIDVISKTQGMDPNDNIPDQYLKHVAYLLIQAFSGAIDAPTDSPLFQYANRFVIALAKLNALDEHAIDRLLVAARSIMETKVVSDDALITGTRKCTTDQTKKVVAHSFAVVEPAVIKCYESKFQRAIAPALDAAKVLELFWIALEPHDYTTEKRITDESRNKLRELVEDLLPISAEMAETDEGEYHKYANTGIIEYGVCLTAVAEEFEKFIISNTA